MVGNYVAILMLLGPYSVMANVQHFSVQPLNKTGIFFEEIEEAVFYRETKMVITSIKTTSMVGVIEYLEKCNFKIKNLCGLIRDLDVDSYCLDTVNSIRTEINDLKDKELTIHHLTGRNRRSIVDGVGKLSKFLFGTMDAEDSQQIYSQLQNLHNGEQTMFDLFKEQVAVVESNFDKLAKPVQLLSSDVKTIFDRLQDMEVRDAKAAEWRANSTKLLVFEEKFLEMSNIILYKSVQTNKQQDRIIGILGSCNSHKLHPLVFSYPEVEQIMRKFPGQDINSDLITPSHISQMAKVDSLGINGTLIIKIEVPLPEAERYKVFKPYLTPMEKDGTHFSYKIGEEFLAVNSAKTKFTPMSHLELAKCSKILENFSRSLFVCEHNKPIATNSVDGCLSSLFYNPFQKTPNCQHTQVQVANRLTRLVDRNTWLFITNFKILLVIQCQGVSESLELTGQGLITFTANCLVKTEDFILPVSGSRVVTLTVRQPEQVEMPDLKDIDVWTNIGEFEPKLNDTKVKISEYKDHNYNLLDEQNKIKHFRKSVELAETKARGNEPHIPGHTQLIISLIAAMIGLAALVVTIIVCKRRTETAVEQIPVFHLPRKRLDITEISRPEVHIHTGSRTPRIETYEVPKTEEEIVIPTIRAPTIPKLTDGFQRALWTNFN